MSTLSICASAFYVSNNKQLIDWISKLEQVVDMIKEQKDITVSQDGQVCFLTLFAIPWDLSYPYFHWHR